LSCGLIERILTRRELSSLSAVMNWQPLGWNT
jgi:hypothetical protein